MKLEDFKNSTFVILHSSFQRGAS